MPNNNKKSTKILAGHTPEPVVHTPNLHFQKTVQDALVDGLKDPASFCRDFLGIDPYEAQCEFLRESRDVSEANFVAGNRVGKSWTGGVILSWRAFYRYISPFTAPEFVTPHNVYKAVSTSMTIDQAKLSWNYALTFMTTSKRFRPFLEDFVYSPFPTIKLRTKDTKGDWVPSEIWARSLAKNGVYLLGHSINFILVDECAYIRNYPIIEDEVIRMRLADTGGSIFRISTPNGRNFFFDEFQKGLRKEGQPFDPRYYSFRITSWDNPYVSRAYLKEQQERMAPTFYEQNILGEFVSLTDFFKTDNILAMYSGVEHELNGDPERGHEYVLGIDLGAMHDPTVCYVLDITPKDAKPRLVGVKTTSGSWANARKLANECYHKWKPIYSTIDATGAGGPTAERLIEEDGWENAEAFVFGPNSKVDLLSRLQDTVQKAGILFPYTEQTKELVTQMSFYKLDDKRLVQDHVIALALANWSYEKAKKENWMDTTIYDDLQIVPSWSGGASVPSDMLMGPGLSFSLDPQTGLYVPQGYTDLDIDL